MERGRLVRVVPGFGGSRGPECGAALAAEATGPSGGVGATALARDGIAGPRRVLPQVGCHLRRSDYSSHI